MSQQPVTQNNKETPKVIKYSGDAVSEVLDHLNQSKFSHAFDECDKDYVFHNLTPNNYHSTIGCFYCKAEITQDSGCYLFCQYKEHWDHNISIVCCSDTCSVAMKTCIISSCQVCNRDYIHSRYDNDICCLCRNK